MKRYNEASFVAILDNIRSLHNVGSIFRTSDGAGVDRLYLCGFTGTPPRPEIRKAALGAEEHVPWEYHRDTAAVLQQLREQDFQLVALETAEHSLAYRDFKCGSRIALIIGNEYHGLSPDIIAMSDQVIHIPMAGRKISLNVAVAFGIAAYAINSQKKYGDRS